MNTTQSVKVAVVDDHKLFRKGILELVNGFSGYTVSLEAEHGKDLIRKLFPENVPDIVLLDISMPVMDGFETARWLREHYPTIKVLTLSMNNDEDTVIRMLKCGVDGYMLKNADPSELRMALEAMQADGTYYTSSVGEIMKHDLIHKKITVDDLTDREIEFLKLVCTDLPYKAFDSLMQVKPRVVEMTRDNLFRKLEVGSRVGLALYAIKSGIYKNE